MSTKKMVALDDKEKSLKQKYEEIAKKLEKEKKEKEDEQRLKLDEAKKILAKKLEPASSSENKATGFKRPTINKTVPPTNGNNNNGNNNYNNNKHHDGNNQEREKFKRFKSENSTNFEDGEYEEQVISDDNNNNSSDNNNNKNNNYNRNGTHGAIERHKPPPYYENGDNNNNNNSDSNNNNFERQNRPNGYHPYGGSNFRNGNSGGYQPREYSPKNNSNAIFVGDLTPIAQEQTLNNIFKEFGEITSIRLFPSRGFAFVNYRDSESCSRAIAGMNGCMVDGNPVKVGQSSAGSKIIGNGSGPSRRNNFNSSYSFPTNSNPCQQSSSHSLPVYNNNHNSSTPSSYNNYNSNNINNSIQFSPTASISNYSDTSVTTSNTTSYLPVDHDKPENRIPNASNENNEQIKDKNDNTNNDGYINSENLQRQLPKYEYE
ncbi:hypothetical protein RB653_010116 [Dictyostelium firmibasis]|uniref:RRM domain-containing protein n=1 Tax=Dictyostelium firmibasis TaxID=79012 RepID=A0AAN7TJM0_9MYCE